MWNLRIVLTFNKGISELSHRFQTWITPDTALGTYILESINGCIIYVDIMTGILSSTWTTFIGQFAQPEGGGG